MGTRPLGASTLSPRLGVSFRAEVHMAEIAAFVGEEVDLGVKSGHACFLSTDGGG